MGLTDGMLGFGVCLGANPYNWNSVNTPDTLKVNTYYFVVGRYTRAQKVQLFLDGVLMGSLVPQDLPLYKQPKPSEPYSAIGTVLLFPTPYYWEGDIDDIRVYSRALSDDEIQSLYHEDGWIGN